MTISSSDIKRRTWNWLGHVSWGRGINDCTGVDTRMVKGKRETYDHMAKDSGKGEKPSGMEELEHGQEGLLVQQEEMMKDKM